MHLHDELTPVPLVEEALRERPMTVGETAAVLEVSLAEVVDLACRPTSPLPATYDTGGAIGFYRSDIECWAADQRVGGG